MTITLHEEIEQGTPEWLALRCGLLTASEMKNIITPTLKIADNDKSRAHVNELAVQRITKYVEPCYLSDDMLRGMADEIDSRAAYDKHYARVTRCGFITNDKWGFTLGCSPDGLIEPGGLLECKSRRQKYQFDTITRMEMPDDYMIQVQTALLVSERSYVDFVSYCGGMPMVTLRVPPDEKMQKVILEAAAAFHDKLDERLRIYAAQISVKEARLLPTVRRIEEQMI